MRLLAANCILLACIGVVLTKNETNSDSITRSKRDLQFLKDLFAAKLRLLSPAVPVQNDNVKYLQIPGFEKVIVKAVPKITVVETPMPVPERVVPLDPNMAILGAYLGTKTPEETLVALQRVKGLLQSGIIKARDEVIEVLPPKPPVFVVPPVQGKVIYSSPNSFIPVAPKMVPVPMMPVPMVRPLPVHVYPEPMPALRPLPVPVYPAPPPPIRPLYPAPMPVLRPLPVPVYPPPTPVLRPFPIPKVVFPNLRPIPVPPVIPLELVPTKYSYKQLNGGSVTSYDSIGGDDVIVTKTNIPLPPPPRYIIDRFQKMIFGLPLGVAISPMRSPYIPVAPQPVFARRPYGYETLVPVGPYFPLPDTIINGPSIIEVKTNNPKKKVHHGTLNVFAGAKFVKKPFTSTLVQQQVVVPKPIAVDVPVAVAESDSTKLKDGNYSYKHVHGDGTMTIYTGSATTEPFVTVEHISKLPLPPPEILNRIEDAAAKARHPKAMWGYSFKIANGVGYYESTNKDKIFYSRLLSGGDKHGSPVMPDPLSSNNDEKDTRTHKNRVILEDTALNGNEDLDESNKDKMHNPFLSTKINGEEASSEPKGTTTTEGTSESINSEITPIKKIPPLPTPIAGENKNTGQPQVTGDSRYSYTLLKKDGPVKFESNSDKLKLPKIQTGSSGAYSYTQVQGGKVTNFLQGTNGGPVVIAERVPSAIVDVPVGYDRPPNGVAVGIVEERPAMIKKFPMLPSAIVDVPVGYDRPPNGVAVGIVEERPAMMKKFPRLPSSIVDVPVGYDRPPNGVAVGVVEERPAMMKKFPMLPSAIVDVPMGHLRPPARVPVSVVKNGPAVMQNMPVLPSAIVDVPVGYVGPRSNFAVGVVEKRPALMKNIPVLPSAIVDIPVGHAAGPPAGVAVGVVEKRPSVIFPKPVVSSYMYKQVNHNNPKPFTVVQVGNAPMIEVPRGDVNVKVNEHEHVRSDGTTYPCKEVHLGIPVAPIPVLPTAGVVPTVPSGLIYVPPAKVDVPSPTKKTASHFSYSQVTSKGGHKDAASTTIKPLSLSQNPIVVAPENSNYSYTTKNSDGSSVSVQSNKDNTVTVNVEDSRGNTFQGQRGDIPDALS